MVVVKPCAIFSSEMKSDTVSYRLSGSSAGPLKAFLQHGRNGGIVLGGPRNISLHVLKGDAHRRFPFEGKVVGQHFIKNDTQE